jgi:hypothetical protein
VVTSTLPRRRQATANLIPAAHDPREAAQVNPNTKSRVPSIALPTTHRVLPTLVHVTRCLDHACHTRSRLDCVKQLPTCALSAGGV